eukprot:2382209-Rhodomonas_salina.1
MSGTGLSEVWPDGAPTAARARGSVAYHPTRICIPFPVLTQRIVLLMSSERQYCVPLPVLTSAYPPVLPVRARAYWSTARGTDAGA